MAAAYLFDTKSLRYVDLNVEKVAAYATSAPGVAVEKVIFQ
jgi:hypothetical protein